MELASLNQEDDPKTPAQHRKQIREMGAYLKVAKNKTPVLASSPMASSKEETSPSLLPQKLFEDDADHIWENMVKAESFPQNILKLSDEDKIKLLNQIEVALWNNHDNPNLYFFLSFRLRLIGDVWVSPEYKQVVLNQLDELSSSNNSQQIYLRNEWLKYYLKIETNEVVKETISNDYKELWAGR